MHPTFPTLTPELAQLLRIIYLIPGLDIRAYARSQTPITELRRLGLVVFTGSNYGWRGAVTITSRGPAYLETHDLRRFGREPDPEFATALAAFEDARHAYQISFQPKEPA